VPPRLKAVDVIDVLSDLSILRGLPEHVRSGNGREFVVKTLQEWIAAVGAKAAALPRVSRTTFHMISPLDTARGCTRLMPLDLPLMALAVASSRTSRDTHSTAGVGANVRDAHKDTVRTNPLPLMRTALSFRAVTSANIADQGKTV
jgi:hypothetical protein